MNWLPIESAPKDGSAVLARSRMYELPFVVFWGSRAEVFGPIPALPEGSVIERTWMLSGADEDGCFPVFDPEEWQPLPPGADDAG